jgi:hypothetical protein
LESAAKGNNISESELDFVRSKLHSSTGPELLLIQVILRDTFSNRQITLNEFCKDMASMNADAPSEFWKASARIFCSVVYGESVEPDKASQNALVYVVQVTKSTPQTMPEKEFELYKMVLGKGTDNHKAFVIQELVQKHGVDPTTRGKMLALAKQLRGSGANKEDILASEYLEVVIKRRSASPRG